MPIVNSQWEIMFVIKLLVCYRRWNGMEWRERERAHSDV